MQTSEKLLNQQRARQYEIEDNFVSTDSGVWLWKPEKCENRQFGRVVRPILHINKYFTTEKYIYVIIALVHNNNSETS